MFTRIKEEYKKNPLSFVGMVLSMIGAHLTADSATHLRFWGFTIWLISNGIITYIFYRHRDYFMSFTYFYFEFQNIRGIANNW